jgi:hypothetical protein
VSYQKPIFETMRPNYMHPFQQPPSPLTKTSNNYN